MTAGELAQELEVSERTIYRDMDALSVASVPVCGERGPDGGYFLLDGYRTSLTGLTGDELRAFFMLSIPQPLADLGVGRELKQALLKLSATLPSRLRNEEQRVRQRFLLDAAWWSEGDEPMPHLSVVHTAIWQDHRLRIAYSFLLPPHVEVQQVVDPYGLVAKAGVWYMVYAINGGVRARRVTELDSAEVLGETFVRPDDFDLAAFWQRWCAEYEEQRNAYGVTARVAPEAIPYLPRFFGEGVRRRLAEAGQPDERGWITLQLTFGSLPEARGRLLALGRALEVLEPAALRVSIIDYAGQITALYTG
jgi:predicted DNA-binding transcriptional regulator YafY